MRSTPMGILPVCLSASTAQASKVLQLLISTKWAGGRVPNPWV